ncbi:MULTISPECIES: heme exporter protein CcmD [unclassified Legionella]|uniref:heme exporter protein CcmD n=1 Tax=unclassified Legionella TaxID=2622702 RepID=UPI0013EFB3D3|nr:MULTISPECIES: heme exporter protein CcmD [unclassified Legionella]MDI9818585.1 heme exporter protein CcmD [Legionella sp. PL877]
MNQFLKWWAMGGYSIYIWPAYGLVCVVLVMNILGIKFQRAQARKKLQQWFKRQQ